MKWEDFGPFVLPYVVGCPLPTMVHHVRLAAIEFCKRTKCWARNLEPVTAFDPHVVEIEPESPSARILAIESCNATFRTSTYANARTTLLALRQH